MTLIELLVVIMILMILTVVVVPRLQPASEERGVRESARLVNTFLNAARNQAVANGRPVGVLIRRDPVEPNAATILEQVEIPAEYAGDVNGAMAQVQYVAANTNFQVRFQSNTLSSGLVRKGDLIQFNHQGPIYKFVTAGHSNGYYDFTGGPPWTSALELELVDTSTGYKWPWPDSTGTPDWSNPISFSIVRQPVDPNTSVLNVMRSATESLTLPSRMVIDLAYSGREGVLTSGLGGGAEFRQYNSNDHQPVIVMFSSTGAIAGIYCVGPTGVYGQQPAIAPIFLLIGKLARMADLDGNLMPDGGDERQSNLVDLTNLWVSINPQSGLITTSNMAAVTNPLAEPDPSSPTYDVEFTQYLSAARQYATQAQTKGGR